MIFHGERNTCRKFALGIAQRAPTAQSSFFCFPHYCYVTSKEILSKQNLKLIHGLAILGILDNIQIFWYHPVISYVHNFNQLDNIKTLVRCREMKVSLQILYLDKYVYINNENKHSNFISCLVQIQSITKHPSCSNHFL